MRFNHQLEEVPFMKQARLSLLIFVVLVWVMAFAGCAKPPDAERQGAKVAMDAAVTAGADQYAAPDLEAAKKIWDTAESHYLFFGFTLKNALTKMSTISSTLSLSSPRDFFPINPTPPVDQVTA